MELVNIAERPSWRESFSSLGLAGEAEFWSDGLFAVISHAELKAVVTTAEAVTARMKGILERCFTERRLKSPWQLEENEERAIRSSFATRHQSAVQRLDFVQTREGGFALSDIEIDPVEGFLGCALMQWMWIEERLGSRTIPSDFDQFNRLNESMLDRVRKMGADGVVLHALFDMSDRASAAMAGYMVNLGIQTGTEVRPVHHTMVSTDGQMALDPSGMPISTCWRSRIPGDNALFHSPLFSGVSFTTPAWYRLLPGIFETMGELTPVDERDVRRHRDGLKPTLSVWLVNRKAVACSCDIAYDVNPALKWNISHVVR